MSDIDTRREALDSVDAATLRRRALNAIAASGSDGLTADEVAHALMESVLAIRPRITELRQAQIVVDSGKRRANASGRNAIVWIKMTVSTSEQRGEQGRLF